MEGNIAIIQGRDDGDLGQGGRGREDEKWSDSGYSLKVEQTVFADGLEVGFKRKRVKNNAQFFELCNWS